ATPRSAAGRDRGARRSCRARHLLLLLCGAAGQGQLPLRRGLVRDHPGAAVDPAGGDGGRNRRVRDCAARRPCGADSRRYGELHGTRNAGRGEARIMDLANLAVVLGVAMFAFLAAGLWVALSLMLVGLLAIFLAVS